MGNIIVSSEDCFRAFLRGIRKSNTSVVMPAYWNPFYNEVQLQWTKTKLPLVEFSQKRIDDLETLRIVTDGSTLVGAQAPINETGPGTGIFTVPSLYTQTNQGILESSNGYPLYLHGLNVMVRKSTTGQWKPVRIRKSDKTVMMAENPYRVPGTDRIYFEFINGQIRIIGGDAEDYLRLEYIRYPRVINYSATPLLNIDPEFAPSQNQEIVETAVRIYLERIMDPRYKSFLQEEMIRSQGQ